MQDMDGIEYWVNNKSHNDRLHLLMDRQQMILNKHSQNINYKNKEVQQNSTI